MDASLAYERALRNGSEGASAEDRARFEAAVMEGRTARLFDEIAEEVERDPEPFVERIVEDEEWSAASLRRLGAALLEAADEAESTRCRCCGTVLSDVSSSPAR